MLTFQANLSPNCSSVFSAGFSQTASSFDAVCESYRALSVRLSGVHRHLSAITVIPCLECSDRRRLEDPGGADCGSDFVGHERCRNIPVCLDQLKQRRILHATSAAKRQKLRRADHQHPGRARSTCTSTARSALTCAASTACRKAKFLQLEVQVRRHDGVSGSPALRHWFN